MLWSYHFAFLFFGRVFENVYFFFLYSIYHESNICISIAASKTAMNLFSHMPEVTSREKELMKACTDAELVAAILGNAKITAPGLTQLKQKQKKGKKAGKNN